jgi:predicted GNAT family acetyltransferase
MPEPTEVDAPVAVRHNAAEHQYEVVVGEEVAGRAVYEDRGDVRVFVHTEVDERFEGRGLAGRLVGAALDHVRDERRLVEARCPYVRAFIEKHAEYQDLLAP